jgi:hypothetical protein
MKKILLIAVLILTTFSQTVFAQGIIIDKTPTPELISLSDINGHPYENAIDYLLQKGIISGYPDGTFKPNQTVNRAEFTKMIVNAAMTIDTSVSLSMCFPDVKDQWFARYVCFARIKQIISGYPDGFFRPEQTINFVEASKILVLTNKLAYQNGDTWYYGYVKSLEDSKYIPVSITKLDQQVTRAELAEMLWRILQKKSDQTFSKVLPVINKGPAGWTAFSKDGFVFNHPSWVGYMRNGWDYLSDQLKNIEGLDTKNYEIVDHYLASYKVTVSASASDDAALNTKVWFGHPLVNSKYLTINGLPAMRREYRAYPGDVLNGRTIGYDEVIIVYTYRKGTSVKVMQYFNAHPPTAAEMIAIFEQIAATVREG